MKLPYGDRTNQEQIANKIQTYALNFEHRDGKHKARLFKAKLGITIANQVILETALIQAAKNNEAIPTETNQYGEKYVIDFRITTEIGSSIVRSCWIIRFGENYPRLTTVYPLN